MQPYFTLLDEDEDTMELVVEGRLYEREGGCADKSPSKGEPLQLPLAGQKVVVTYEAQLRPCSAANGDTNHTSRTFRTTTNYLGSFRVATAIVENNAIQLHVTVKYYGQESERRNPLIKHKKVLRTTRWRDTPHLALVGHPGPDTQGPWGRYELQATLADEEDGDPPFKERIAKLSVEPADDTQWLDLAQLDKEDSAVDITLLGKNPQCNSAMYAVNRHDGKVGFAAVQAVYRPDDSTALKSKPFILAFGFKAELSWKNNARQPVSGIASTIASTPEYQDEVLLQRPVTHKGQQGYGNPLFQSENALVTLRLSSLLDHQRRLQGVPVTWRLANQPPDMAVFLQNKVEDNGIEWSAADQRAAASTDDSGESRVSVSARQLYRMVDKDQSNWRSYTPTTGHAVVRADIQGQREQIQVPFIDSQWLAMEGTEDDKGYPYLKVLGYLGTDRQTPASRKLVAAQFNEESSTQGRQALFSARSARSADSTDSTDSTYSTYSTYSTDSSDPSDSPSGMGSPSRLLFHKVQKSGQLGFACEDSCRQALASHKGFVCLQQVRPDDSDPLYVQGGQEEAQESRTNITMKFVSKSKELHKESRSCCPPHPIQPAIEQPVADGAFCYDLPPPTLLVRNEGPDTEGPQGPYFVDVRLPKNKGHNFGPGPERDNIRLEATQDVSWPDPLPPLKDVNTIIISRISRNPDNSSDNTLSYKVESSDEQAGVVALKVVYETEDGGIESESVPLLLAFGYNAELDWSNNAPQTFNTDKQVVVECPHEPKDEVILQRPVAPGAYSNAYFQEEHALVTLRLKSLLDNNRLLGNIPVTWQLAAKQPPNMAVFLQQTTGNPDDQWNPAAQQVDSRTNTDGHSECPVSARQLYKMENKDKENWRPYTPAVGKAVVVANIQGQLERIEVPFIDSLWQLFKASKDAESIPQLSALGYVGTDRKSKASRPHVTEQMTDPWSTEGRQLRLSARRADQSGYIFSFLLPQEKTPQAPSPLQFPCGDACRGILAQHGGVMCIEQVRPIGANFSFGGLSEETQESRKNITIKFVSEESSEACASCSPQVPDQPDTAEPVEDGAFCLDMSSSPGLSNLADTQTAPVQDSPSGHQAQADLADEDDGLALEQLPETEDDTPNG